MWETVRKAAALLLGRFASVGVLAFLEGQQIGLLLLQLPLELLGLALLLQLPPLILLGAGRITFNPDQETAVGEPGLNNSATRTSRLDPGSGVPEGWLLLEPTAGASFGWDSGNNSLDHFFGLNKDCRKRQDSSRSVT